jgi:hypothetical protein
MINDSRFSKKEVNIISADLLLGSSLRGKKGPNHLMTQFL